MTTAGISTTGTRLVKPREVTFILQNGERHAAQPNPNGLLVQTYERVVGRPRDGSPMEIYDNDGAVVSSRSAADMVGRSFRVGLRQFPGGAFRGKRAKAGASRGLAVRPSNRTLPRCPRRSSTKPRPSPNLEGRLEMGGLLIGHVDHEGNNVVVCGFFRVKTKRPLATVNSAVRSTPLLRQLAILRTNVPVAHTRLPCASLAGFTPTPTSVFSFLALT